MPGIPASDDTSSLRQLQSGELWKLGCAKGGVIVLGLGVSKGVWFSLEHFERSSFQLILSHSILLCDKRIFYQPRSTLWHLEVWVLCSCIWSKKGIWEVSRQETVWRDSRCEGGYHPGLLQTFDWGENKLKINIMCCSRCYLFFSSTPGPGLRTKSHSGIHYETQGSRVMHSLHFFQDDGKW